MNCGEFQNKLNQLELQEFDSADLREHAGLCSKCSAELIREKKILGGLKVLSRCVVVPDLSKEIVNRLAQLPDLRSNTESSFERFLKFFFRGNLWASAAVCGVAILLLFSFFHSLKNRPTEFTRIGQKSSETWSVQLVSGSPTEAPVGFKGSGEKFPLGINQKLAIQKGEMILALGEEVEARLTNGKIETLQNGLRLFEGKVHSKVKPRVGKPAFFVETVFGTVSVHGTDFLVDISERKMKIKVFEGAVKVATSEKSWIINAHHEETIEPTVAKPSGGTPSNSSHTSLATQPSGAPPGQE